MSPPTIVAPAPASVSAVALPMPLADAGEHRDLAGQVEQILRAHVTRGNISIAPEKSLGSLRDPPRCAPPALRRDAACTGRMTCALLALGLASAT